MSLDFRNDSQSMSDFDWNNARLLSLRPGGFGDERTTTWAKLLAFNERSDRAVSSSNDTKSTTSHPDERQIKLDTDRSFVLYPVGGSGAGVKDREALQEELRELIVDVFQRRPKLSYFQGYHDIITVLFLTLPPELRLICAESVSLQRLRDSMGAGLEPIVGLLRVLNNLFRVVDPAFAAILQETSPLPYFALSNLLTLFAHDMPTLELIQHVFDYILCRPPIIIVYLAATIALSRKVEVERLQQAGEEGMVHSILSGLPEITDNTQEARIKEDETLPTLGEDDSPVFSLSEKSEKQDLETPPSGTLALGSADTPTPDILQAEEKEEESIYSRPITPLPRKPIIPLTDLLTRSDELFASYPPTHPSLQLASIMGPQSVVYTWSENPSDMPDPAEAEAMVEHPELVIKPLPRSEDDDEGGRSRRRAGRPQKDWRLVSHGSNVVLASTVLVLSLSIIVALYGPKDSGKDFTKASRWAAGAFLGVGERWVAAFTGL